MIMRAKYKITVYDHYLKNYKFIIMSNEKVEILYLNRDNVNIKVRDNEGYISYGQFKNGLIE